MNCPKPPSASRFPALSLALLLLATPAVAAVGDWAQTDHVRVRLIAAGGDGLGAAVELQLAPGWKTYWRTPGDSGIPPEFDFSGSKNLGPVEVRFPVPERFDDGYSISNVYHDRVILPLATRALDPARPAEIAMALDIGICADVCIPARLDATLSVPAGEKDDDVAATLKQAAATLPGAPEPGTFAVDAVSRTGGSDNSPEFAFTATLPDPEAATVFVEGPADWFATVPKLVSRDGDTVHYSVAFDRLGSQHPIAGASLRFTVVSSGRSIEQTLALD